MKFHFFSNNAEQRWMFLPFYIEEATFCAEEKQRHWKQDKYVLEKDHRVPTNTFLAPERQEFLQARLGSSLKSHMSQWFVKQAVLDV